MSLNYLSSVFFFISVCFLTCSTVKAIVGGKLAQEHQFPYQVSVIVRGRHHICGGVIIGDRYVITGASCVIDSTFRGLRTPIFILAGTNDYNKTAPPAVSVAVEKVFFPKEFIETKETDIGVLKLAESLQLAHRHATLTKLELTKDEPRPQEIATIASFGADNYHQNLSLYQYYTRRDGKLRYAHATVIRDDSCARQHQQRSGFRTELYFCAHMRPVPFYDFDESYGVCYFDQGSPLVYNGRIIGILTANPIDCNERIRPAAYTRVSRFSRIIANIVEHGHDPSISSMNA